MGALNDAAGGAAVRQTSWSMAPAKRAGRVAAIRIARLLCLFLSGLTELRAAEPSDPMFVVQRYVRATYARDFIAAYRLISAEDRKIRDLNRYVRQRGAYGGFTLEAAKKLSEFIELQALKTQASPNRMQMLIKYRIPDPQKIAPLVLNWNPQRLNSLSASERKTILDTLDSRQRAGALSMTEGEESFELIREPDEWRIFLDWAAGVKIPLRLDLSKSANLAVTLSQQDFTLQPGELFEVKLKITNRSAEQVTARIGHGVEPASIADYLDFVQCGFLLPITLQPGKEQEYSGTYMLRGSLPEGVRQLSLTYDFRLLK